jgi:hypothetical protein
MVCLNLRYLSHVSPRWVSRHSMMDIRQQGDQVSSSFTGAPRLRFQWLDLAKRLVASRRGIIYTRREHISTRREACFPRFTIWKLLKSSLSWLFPIPQSSFVGFQETPYRPHPKLCLNQCCDRRMSIKRRSRLVQLETTRRHRSGSRRSINLLAIISYIRYLEYI